MPARCLWLLLLLPAWVSTAWALPSFEPFANATAAGGTTYANGAALYYQTNALGEGWARWNGGSLLQWVACTNSGLSYGGFPAAFPAASVTNAIHVPGNDDASGGIAGQSAALIFSKIIAADTNNVTVNAVYASFLIQVATLGTLAQNATYFGGLATNDAASDNLSISLPNSAMKIFLRGNSSTPGASTSWSIGVANNSGQASAAYDGGGHTAGTVLFVVVDYEFGINGNPDYARLWVNPAASTFGAGAPPTPTGSTAGITGANRIAQAADFFLEDRASSTMWGSLQISDLRVGTTWAYVTGGPEITNAPASLTNTPFTPAIFQVGAVSGSLNNPLSYQWKTNGVALTDGSGVVGSATARVALAGVTQTNAANYSVVVANALGAVTNAATLTVLDPYISAQPVPAQNLTPGSTAGFTVTATGSAPLTYQWARNGVGLKNGPTGSGSTISGATTAGLMISGLGTNDAGTYSVALTNGLHSSLLSSNAVLMVNDPVITSAPAGVTVNYQGGAVFTVTAAGTPPLAYQWQYQGSNLVDGLTPSGSGATVSGTRTATLTLTNLAYADSGNYSVVVTNGHGNPVSSGPARLTVTDPCVTAPPVNQTNVAGTTAHFSVVAAGSGLVTYQWQKNGTPLTNGGNIAGATTASLTIASVSSADAATYAVTISGSGQAAGTQSAVVDSAALVVLNPLTVNPGTILITNFQGWGCSLCWWANIIGGFPNRDYYADLAFTQLKLNIVRYNIGGGENPGLANTEDYYAQMQGFEPSPGVWNWSADANQRWMLQAALARGVTQIEAFANSPPWWMTVSGSVTGARGGTNNLQVAEENTFAVYLATVISNLTVLDGVHFDYVTPMNEPLGGWSYGNYQEGCHMSSDQQARLVNDLRTSLNAQGLTTGIDASEDSGEQNAVTSLSAYDNYGYTPAPLSNVNLVSTHTYGATEPTEVYDLAQSLNDPLWVTEYGNTDPTGMALGRRIHDDLTQLMPNAWICWQVVKNDSHTSWGLMYNPLVAATNAIYTTNAIFHESFSVMGQFSEFISPGSQILSLGDNYTIAAYNHTNQTLVLVTLNDTASPFTVGYDLSTFGSVPVRAAVYRTSTTETVTPLPGAVLNNRLLVANCPADSVTTFVMTGVSLPSPKLVILSPKQIQLSWPYGTLETATNVAGPYAPLPGVSSPCVISPSNQCRFFLVQ